MIWERATEIFFSIRVNLTLTKPQINFHAWADVEYKLCIYVSCFCLQIDEVSVDMHQTKGV